MGTYILDENLRRVQLVEGWQSYLWTERWQASGQFQIKIPWTPDRQDMFQPKALLARDDSWRVMRTEIVSDAVDDSGQRILTVIGRSIESMLEKRAGLPVLASLTTSPNWTFSDLPQNIAKTIFTTTCLGGTPSVDYRNNFPFYVNVPFLTPGSIPMPSSPVSIAVTLDTVYAEIVAVCQTYDLGFRMTRQNDTSHIYFDIYTGDDHTSAQTVNDPVIFDPQMNNLSQVEQVSSIADEMTVAVVVASNGYQVVFSPNYDTALSGFDREELLIVANDITLPAGAALNTALQSRGLQALAAKQKTYAFDGIIPPNNGYVYQQDYGLGDLVEERNTSKYGSTMRVTEVTFSSDDQGNDSVVPTLVQVRAITPGTWSAVPGTRHWATEPTTEHWADFTG